MEYILGSITKKKQRLIFHIEFIYKTKEKNNENNKI